MLYKRFQNVTTILSITLKLREFVYFLNVNISLFKMGFLITLSLH